MTQFLMPPTDICALSAHELSRAIHARHVSCVEVMQAYLKRIAVVNPHVNAIVSLQDEGGLVAQAAHRDALLARGESLGWMHGMPQAIKDLSNTAGIPTVMGSPLMRKFVPSDDGLMAHRMKAAGCIVVGKTNTPEFGLGSHTFNEVFGATRNPFDLSRTAGGSSGGAAAALATHLLPVADGSDFMGSLRNPAAWNNVFGFRPSQGRVPMWPAADAYISQLGTEGPMGRTVQDVARLLQVQAGPDNRAPLSIANHVDFTKTCGDFDCKNTRIGWLGDLGGYLAMEPGILDVCEQGLRRFEGLGCTVEPIALGFSPEAVWDAWLVWRRALVASRIAPFLLNPENRNLIKPEALWEHDQAQSLNGNELLAASAQRTAFYQHLLTLFERYDFLAIPTAQVWPFEVTLRWPSDINGRAMDTYHRWMEVVIYATFAGLPCMSVPAGFSNDIEQIGVAASLPMGIQIIGRPQGDLSVLQVCAAYEQAAQSVLARRPA
jgi:amidase